MLSAGRELLAIPAKLAAGADLQMRRCGFGYRRSRRPTAPVSHVFYLTAHALCGDAGGLIGGIALLLALSAAQPALSHVVIRRSGMHA